jgi:hypothetical protein
MKSHPESWALYSVSRRQAKINPRPAFQRGPVWSKANKQLLMDSVFRGMDIPKLYLSRAKAGGNHDFDVVDGQQRLRSVWEFYADRYPLSPKFTPEAGALYCSQLPDDVRDKFDAYQFQFVIIEEGTREEISDMFIRLQKGIALNPAERRNAMTGKMRDFVTRLAQDSFFSKVGLDNKRLGFHEVAAQVTLLELSGGPAKVRAEELERMYQQFRDNFDQSRPEARRVRRILRFLDRAFPGKTPELKKHFVLSLYLLVSTLDKTYDIKGRETSVRDFFLDFDRRLKTQTTDPEVVKYSLRARQGTADKESIEERHKILMTNFLMFAPDLVPLDKKRGFTEDERIAIWRRDREICQICGEKLDWDDLDIDHVKPWGEGGLSNVQNGRAAHQSCNRARRASS